MRAALASVLVAAAEEGALQEARRLAASVPKAEATKYGEFEGHEWWENHTDVFREAWREYGTRRPDLYWVDDRFEAFLDPGLRAALEAVSQGEAEERLWPLVEQLPDSVFSLPLFTPSFVESMLEEMDEKNLAGIPIRRPNGMNRHGLILEEVGFEAMLRKFTDRIARPLAQMLFPDLVSHDDAVEHFGFVVRYRQGEDVSLEEHADASVVTMNVCLGKEWEGGELVMGKYTSPYARLAAERSPAITHTPGRVLIHRGQHRHSAAPILAGERVNFILWLFGDGGFVRVAEHDPHERTTEAERWRCLRERDRCRRSAAISPGPALRFPDEF